MAVSDPIENMKSSSSAWVKKQDSSLAAFYWQAGYGVFSVSQSRSDLVKKYIANLEEHHRQRTFQNEFRELLERHEIAFDEQYVWD